MHSLVENPTPVEYFDRCNLPPSTITYKTIYKEAEQCISHLKNGIDTF